MHLFCFLIVCGSEHISYVDILGDGLPASRFRV